MAGYSAEQAMTGFAAIPDEIWCCKACGPSLTSRADWCDRGCGNDYNEMFLIRNFTSSSLYKEIKAAEREQCAKEMDLLAYCEECHDCRDDLIRSEPYRRAAKYLRANIGGKAQ
jgi:hypothetical protein